MHISLIAVATLLLYAKPVLVESHQDENTEYIRDTRIPDHQRCNTTPACKVLENHQDNTIIQSTLINMGCQRYVLLQYYLQEVPLCA